MTIIHARASKIIDAPPEKVYAVLADYHVGHPAILPKPAFEGITVDKGGYGDGTETQVHMNAFGKRRTVYHVVSEPEPGRILVETDKDTGLKTTFTVDPVDGGARSHVTIDSEFKQSSGLRGITEKMTIPLLIGGVFKKELRNLAKYVTET